MNVFLCFLFLCELRLFHWCRFVLICFLLFIFTVLCPTLTAWHAYIAPPRFVPSSSGWGGNRRLYIYISPLLFRLLWEEGGVSSDGARRIQRECGFVIFLSIVVDYFYLRFLL